MSNQFKDHNIKIVRILEEHPELIKDRTWRLNNLYWIVSKDGDKQVFSMNRAQKDFYDRYLNVPLPYHRHCILKSRQLGFCLDPKTKVLTADLLWVPIENLIPGQEVVSVDEMPTRGRGAGRRMKPAIVQKVVEVFRDAYKILFEDGRTVICTGAHPWLSKSDTIKQPAWRTINQNKEDRAILHTSKIKVGDYVRYITKPWGAPTVEDGWFSGILDGEGSISKTNSSAGINVSQLPGKVFDRMLNYVQKNGYNYRIEDDKTERKTKYGKKPVPKICIGRLDEMFQLIGKLRPSRFINNHFWDNRELPGKKSSIGWAKIVSIEQLPDQRMIDLQTSSGTYIAEGFVSHNTTFIDLFILDAILFSTNKDAIIIAHKVEDATAIFDKKVDFALRNMAEDVKGAFFSLRHNSARKVQVTIDYGPDKGSTSSITVSVSGRSGTYHLVHVSEFAKMCALFSRRAEEVETGTFPTVPFDGFIFIESTAEGMAGRFYEIFQQNWLNREKINPLLSQVQFLPHFYNWQYDDMEMKKIYESVPVAKMEECEIDWGSYQAEHNLTDKEITYYYMKWLQFGGKNSPDAVKKLMQEYPTTPEEAFLSTGQTYFPTAKIASLLATPMKGERGELGYNEKGDVIFNPHSSGNLEVFKKPELGTRYIVGGDTAEGLASGDAQVLYVINHKTEECDAVYRSQVSPDELATEAYKLGKYYNWALLGIEVNKDGLWVNDALEKMGYVNLYYRKVFDDITQKITKFFGWKTTSATRPFCLAALKAVFFRKATGFPPALLNEMFTFIRNVKGKPEAMDKKRDDVIMAASIGYAILGEQGKYVDTTTGGEGFSHLRAIFGEETGQINH